MGRIRLLVPIVSILFLSGCAHVISKDLRERADPSVNLVAVRENPKAFEGKMVIWGGELIETFNQRDGTTLLEIFHRPLSWRGEPREDAPSEGRFLVLAERYLDPYLFRTGRRVTVAGELRGEKRKLLGEMEYRYPLLVAQEIHLWEFTRPYVYYLYDPWWWGYPYGWRFHFHYHRSHRW